MPENHSILVVEDDQDVREAMVQVLESEGYVAVPAGDGEEAVDRLRDGLEPCLILLDLMMPRMDGWQFIEHQRQQQSSIPIVVVSAYGSGEQVRATGIAEYMRKPVDIDALLALVARFCAKQ